MEVFKQTSPKESFLLEILCTFDPKLILPRQVEDEGAAGGVAGGEVAIAENDGLGLVGVEEVGAAQVGSQRAHYAEYDACNHFMCHIGGSGDGSLTHSGVSYGIIQRINEKVGLRTVP